MKNIMNIAIACIFALTCGNAMAQENLETKKTDKVKVEKMVKLKNVDKAEKEMIKKTAVKTPAATKVELKKTTATKATSKTAAAKKAKLLGASRPVKVYPAVEKTNVVRKVKTEKVKEQK